MEDTQKQGAKMIITCPRCEEKLVEFLNLARRTGTIDCSKCKISVYLQGGIKELEGEKGKD